MVEILYTRKITMNNNEIIRDEKVGSKEI